MDGEKERVEPQKSKLLQLARIFHEETDEKHGLTMAELIDRLAECGIRADRRTLYRDLNALRREGVDIVGTRQNQTYAYYQGSRTFELPELKLLVDAVQSSRFITAAKSRSLIRKLESMASRHEAELLNRQVVISGRVKTMNESIYTNVDRLHEAINQDVRIRFRYVQWNLEKRLVNRHGGAWYIISPWALIWNNENYYLLGYDAAQQKLKHYRVDKMKSITLQAESREGKEAFREIDLSRYSNTLFKMFGGEIMNVTLEADNDMVGVVLDRFGRQVELRRVGEDRFRVEVRVAVSPQFLGWVMSMGGGIRIVSPERVVNRMREELKKLSAQYPG